MEEEHDNFKDLDKICSNIIPYLGSNNNNSSKQDKVQKNQGQRRFNSFEDQMLAFMSENKRLLNIHEQKFFELAEFQANTIVFQANTNASLKNLETQVGKLALVKQNQSKDAFPRDTRKI